MGQAGQNALISGGIVVPSTENVEAITGTLTGLSSTVPLEETQVEDIKDSVALLLESESETGTAAETFEEPVVPTDIPDEVNDAILELEAELGIDIEIEDQGDLVAAILLMDLMDKKDVKDAGGLTPEEELALDQEIAEDADQAINFILATSPVGSLDLTGALGDLLNGLAGRSMSRALARVDADPAPVDVTEVISMAAPLFEMYFDLADANNDGTVTTEEIRSIRNNFANLNYMIELRHSVSASLGEQSKLSTLVMYISAAVYVFNEELFPGSPDFAGVMNDIHAYIAAGETAVAPSWVDETYIEALMNRITGLSHFAQIKSTILAISANIPSNEWVTDQLTTFFNSL